MQIFVKFGEEEHLKQLQSEGLLYCRSVLDFARMENDLARGDINEKTAELELLSNKEIWLKSKQEDNDSWKKLNLTHFQKRIYDNEYKGNLFCMSSFPINKGASIIPISKRFKEELGESYLLVLNQPEFFRRLHNTFIRNEISYERKLVDYFDIKNYTGKKSIFAKDNYFSWQNEYRIFIKTGVTELQTFKIGNIEDITELGRLNDDTSFLIREAK